MGCIVLVLGVGRCAFRPPRVVFVLGLVSLINSLTSGKRYLLPVALVHSHQRKSHFWQKSLSQETFPRRFRKRPFYCTVTVPYPATASCSMSSVGSTLQWGVHEVRLHEATTLYQSFSRAAVPCLPVTSHHPPTPPTTHTGALPARATCHSRALRVAAPRELLQEQKR